MDEPEQVNFITCATWVPRGKAKTNPDKVEMSKKDLARLIKETGDEVKDLEESEVEGSKGANEDESMEVGEEEEGAKTETKDAKYVRSQEDDNLDFEDRYVMNNYGNEEEEDLVKLIEIGQLAIHATDEDDPYIKVKDKDDVDSEDGDDEILPSDNLIAVGHVEGTAAILEVYVYNAEEGHLYVHHDFFLPAIPLCMEWLNYDPGDEQLAPGNMVAIGSMSSVVEVWDLDIVNCLVPAYKLGKKGNKKKKIASVGHKDAVLALAWNRYAEHVLASGSVDQTVILWDLQFGKVAQQLKSFDEKVQCLQWHHTEPQSLLTGACDNTVRLFDCNTSESFKSWKLDGEVECVTWDMHSSNPNKFLACTDQGTVYAIDSRQEEPLWTLNAHSEGCSGLQLSPECPGCLVTTCVDESVKVWDVAGDKPTLIKEKKLNIGRLTCLSTCPDLPFVFCMGGDKREDNFKVWDIREMLQVRTTFCSRVGLPADDEGIGESAAVAYQPTGNYINEEVPKKGHVVLFGDSGQSEPSSTRPKSQSEPSSSRPKKFHKKKGGRLETKRRKR